MSALRSALLEGNADWLFRIVVLVSGAAGYLTMRVTDEFLLGVGAVGLVIVPGLLWVAMYQTADRSQDQ